jgi:hypothetical protein
MGCGKPIQDCTDRELMVLTPVALVGGVVMVIFTLKGWSDWIPFGAGGIALVISSAVAVIELRRRSQKVRVIRVWYSADHV